MDIRGDLGIACRGRSIGESAGGADLCRRRLAALEIFVLALKGPLSWSAVIDGLGNTRLGAALVVAGYAALIALGVRQWRASSH